MQEPQPIKCKAAIAYGPKQQLIIEEVTVEPPRAGQLRIQVFSNALCHTDVYELDGGSGAGSNWPCILGHQATGIVESVGPGVKRIVVGDIVVPCYTPQCLKKTCQFCENQNTNLCPAIRAFQGKGVMPDGTTRFKNKDGEPIFHFMGCSTFSQYTVIAQISAAKINPNADLNKVCMIGCGVSTGWGAAMNNSNVQAGSTVAVWGLGAVGLSVVQAAKIKGASKVYAIDLNQTKFELAKKFGADVCYKPTAQKSAKQFLLQNEKWGIQYTFDATGNTTVMKEALQSSYRGTGMSCVIGVAESDKFISTHSFQLVTGRRWIGTAFGGWKGVEDVPKLVNKALIGEWPIEGYVTHEYQGLEKVNQSIVTLRNGACLRAIIKISPPPVIDNNPKVSIVSSTKFFGGLYQVIKHWSKLCQCEMTFGIFLPDEEIKHQRGKPYPTLYCLGGLTCTHQNFALKSGYGPHAKKHRIACIFPDTSPRNTGIPNVNADWQFGDSAGYYVDATSEVAQKHFRMYSYITQELPELVSSYFPVSRSNISATGFSMGGHGALMCGLKEGNYKSVSAFAPMANPTLSPNWGIKAYKFFFAKPEEEGRAFDATQLVKSGKAKNVPLFIELGSQDKWKKSMICQNLRDALIEADYQHIWRVRGGYEHNFWYVSTFIEEHFNFHAKYLN